MMRRVHIRSDQCVPELGIIPMYACDDRVRGRSIDAALARLFRIEVARQGFVIMTARGRRELIAVERIAFT